MQQGNPNNIREPHTDEQARWPRAWEGNHRRRLPQACQRHGQDYRMRVLNQQAISPEEVQMSVYIEGVDRAEKLSMKRIGQEWKFGGFMREREKRCPQPKRRENPADRCLSLLACVHVWPRRAISCCSMAHHRQEKVLSRSHVAGSRIKYEVVSFDDFLHSYRLKSEHPESF